MKLLELLESIYHILACCKFLSLLAEFLLSLEVLLEVEITHVAVDLDLVVEFLYIELVGVVEISELGLRHRADFSPAGLEGPELRERSAYILLLLDKGLEFLHDSLLLGEIFRAFLIELTVEFSTFFSELVIE